MRIAGVDEVGRGPLAGPVVAAAVILPEGYINSDIKDSKLLSKSTRERLDVEIKNVALAWSIIAVGSRRIDNLNIREASRYAMALAVKKLKADKVLVDGNTKIDVEIEQQTIIGGDRSVPVISAASIIAKVYRDRLMEILATRFPYYGFEKHAGYPTKAHREAIISHGPTYFHRQTFKGVKEYINY